MSGRQQHWENVYGTKAADQVSWFRPHLEKSLRWIERYLPDRDARVIDVGGGESTLVDDLIAGGYRRVTVLDISLRAINAARARVGERGVGVEWMAADVTAASLPAGSYDLWHDRAVFHFLTAAQERRAYIERVRHAVKHGGYVIVATFGPEGPPKCSGLDVCRYDAVSLGREFGENFRLVESLKEDHQTPFGTSQQFVYCCLIFEPAITA
ncbi:MAG TPA: class I SAM-dependent methyltransferase [Bryobacteraceae bacterium]|nr:class I SAM-dependent methyltransferase [Bryobacteraceae bacterium]